MIDDCVFILINLYKPSAGFYRRKNESNATNTEWFKKQKKKKTRGGGFNLFLNSVLEAEGGSLVLKKSSVSKLIEIKEKHN